MSDNSIQMASHRLCAALHMDGIDPTDIEVHLPHDAWWRLWMRIEQLYRGQMTYDGRGMIPENFKYMGVTYRVKK
jgi:hypothetical protein